MYYGLKYSSCNLTSEHRLAAVAMAVAAAAATAVDAVVAAYSVAGPPTALNDFKSQYVV